MMNRKILHLALVTYFLGLAVSFGQVPDRISPEIKSIPNSLQFFVLGDWGRKGEFLASNKEVKDQESLALAMERVAEVIKPEFIISTGDNFYPAGVKSILDPRWKETFEDVYHGPNLHRRWYVVLGNHDHGGNVKAEIDYDKNKETGRWHLPSNYYSQVMTTTDGALVKFIFIDTTPLVRGADAPQLNWLAKELADNSYDWKWVVGHHPLYSGNHRTSEQTRLKADIEQMLIDNHVDVYLCGHDHNLQYLKKGKINYFISGAGSEIYKSKEVKELTQYVYCKEGVECTSAFMVFSLQKSSFVIQMIDSRGQRVYTNTIEK